jgi:hypothetical protein
MSFPVHAEPFVKQMRRRLPAISGCHHPVDSLERQRGRNAYPSGIPPPNIMSPPAANPGTRTEVRLGARAHTTRTTDRAHAPPANSSSNSTTADPALDVRSLHK